MANSPTRNNPVTPLQAYLNKNGRFPPVTLLIQPLGTEDFTDVNSRDAVHITDFTEYSFQSSVLIPVDAFSFTLRNPTFDGSVYDYIKDGDIAVLQANGTIIATGLVDSVTITTDPDNGELVHIQGRTLMGQLEDQNAVNDQDTPIFNQEILPAGVIETLIANTQINYYRLQQNPIFKNLPIFATEPGESKLSALLRYVEPFNCIVWMDPDGTLVLGRPDMGAAVSGKFTVDRRKRESNCMSISVAYSSTQIPNIIIPVYAAQENVQYVVAKQQALLNAAQGPSRLYSNNFHVPKSIVTSNPQGADPQAASNVNQIVFVGGDNVLAALAKREIARANVNEVNVQVNVKGHYNDDLQPFLIDTTYNVYYPTADLNEKMYVHSVTYTMDENSGQKTSLTLCRLGCIVADITIQSQKASSQKTLGAKS